MSLVIYDCEVFKNDWIVVLKDFITKDYTVIHNDNDYLKSVLNSNDIYVGFNSKHYDQYIIKGIVCGLTPVELKELSDFIINGGQGWSYPALNDFYFKFNNVDIKDDMQMGLSLKSIEGNLYLPICESEIDFTTENKLTEQQVLETVKYCKYDVDCTEKIVELRTSYLKTKSNLGKRVGIEAEKAMGLTNAKLTARLLGASRKEWDDGREYVFPSNLDLNIIPTEIIDFFNTIHDKSISDDELFATSLVITLGDMECKYAWGGVHGSQTSYHEESTSTRVIQNRDVASLYPTLIEEYNYLSRNVADPNIYYQMKKDRIAAKHSGDIQTASDLKLPLNTLSGAQENPFNDLYDPLPTRSLRISGQLFLTVLAMRLINNCKTIKLLNLNTDGIMYSVDKSELGMVDDICSSWEKESKFELEIDNISKVWIKDVNNLLLIKDDGKVKTVGGYLNYGISNKGAWSINNNMTIVKKALIEYFVNNTPIEETINNSTNIFDFQLIAKAGSKYKEVFHLVDNQRIPIQKVNRVYSTKNTKYGKLYKIKNETLSEAKIENLPENCIIDNFNKLTINDIDKDFYIDLARKRLNAFIGNDELIKKGKNKKMATKSTIEKTTDMNVYQKLIKARDMFLNSNIQKTGKNMHLSFKYFELDDIVPSATRIFNDIGLIGIVNFTNDTATMNIINTNDKDDLISFTTPFNQIQPIVSNTGKVATNEMQALGSSITYMRRYLYMLALDICESDMIDANLGADDTNNQVKNTVSKKPLTNDARQEIKTSITDVKSNATELQINALKIALKKLKDSQPDKEEVIQNLAIKTEGFTKITKEDCENLIKKINGMLQPKEII